MRWAWESLALILDISEPSANMIIKGIYSSKELVLLKSPAWEGHTDSTIVPCCQVKGTHLQGGGVVTAA